MMPKSLSVFLTVLLFSLTNALYFHIGETERKCFIEEIPEETIVVGKYRVEMFDKQQNIYVPTIAGLGMHVEVRDPDDKTIMSRTYAADGRFTFTSPAAGEHVICLHSNSSAWFGGGQLRVHLDIQVGEHANDYQVIAAKDKLTELQLRVRQLLDQTEQITKEQNYQRRVHFRTELGVQQYSNWHRYVEGEMAREKHMSKMQIDLEKMLNGAGRLKAEILYHKYREERFRQTSESTNQRVLWWSIAQTLILLLTGFWQMRHLKSFFEAKKLV